MSLQIGETTINSNLIGKFQYYNILKLYSGGFYKIDQKTKMQKKLYQQITELKL